MWLSALTKLYFEKSQGLPSRNDCELRVTSVLFDLVICFSGLRIRVPDSQSSGPILVSSQNRAIACSSLTLAEPAQAQSGRRGEVPPLRTPPKYATDTWSGWAGRAKIHGGAGAGPAMRKLGAGASPCGPTLPIRFPPLGPHQLGSQIVHQFVPPASFTST